MEESAGPHSGNGEGEGRAFHLGDLNQGGQHGTVLMRSEDGQSACRARLEPRCAEIAASLVSANARVQPREPPITHGARHPLADKTKATIAGGRRSLLFLAPEEGFKPVAGDHSRFFRSGSAPCCRSGALAGRLPLGGPNPLILTQNETRPRRDLVSFWLRRRDLNPRPSD